MIGYISGNVKDKQDSEILLEVSGIGYIIFVPATVAASIRVQGNLELYTYQHVREDIIALYGFETRQHVYFFKKLLSVSGVGPKSGLGILSLLSLPELVGAIINNDPEVLTQVSGIGKKTSERLVLELKNQVAGLEGIVPVSSFSKGAQAGVLDALLQLGYSNQEAQNLVAAIPEEITDISEQITYALKQLK